jgi:hypothetical protein
MPWPKEGEVIQCDVCRRKVSWVGRSSSNYTVLDAEPGELGVTLVCGECGALMDHFGFSTYALKRYLDMENKLKAVA